MESLKERLLAMAERIEGCMWRDSDVALANLLREASEALGVSPPADRNIDDDRIVRELMAWACQSPNAIGKAEIQSRLLPAASQMLKRWASSGVSPSGGARSAELKPEDVPAWVQIRAGNELSELVRLVRFAPGQPTGFLHSDFDANGLLWRWALKWAPHMTAPAPPASPSLPREGEK